ncbi:MAG: dTDP-4-dehydrorhamnose reductase [Muribaculaceae bacterium]|nr:dTDP-4-dehydrorhamnose reductase [Muribaculaceae bacterium]
MNSKKILITGAHGQLGSALSSLLQSTPYNVVCTDYDSLDITNSEAVESFIGEGKFDYIVNCAAYTQVDRAEEDADNADLLNHIAVANIANAALNCGGRVIHISTDYVFDGNHFVPYVESDEPAPRSVYGSTKLAGERDLFDIAPDSIVVRTAWLYSATGNNFVKTMLRLGKEKDSIRVVYDQIGSPTYAPDLASAILTIIESETWVPGVYHFTNEGVISWYDFAKAIFRISGVHCEVSPILSSEYKTLAVRPHYSVLDKSKIKSVFGVNIPYWEDSLQLCIKLLNK